MHASRLFKSSPHCSASPNGKFIATLSSSSTILIRSIRSLQAVHTVKLPPDFSSPVLTLAWSPSSSRIMVANTDQIHVFSATDSPFRATVRNPALSGVKSPLVRFGARDSEILIYAAFGLKLVIFDLSTSKAVEINSPKFHLASSVSRGLSIQSNTQHIALLTRAGGRDAVSIHHPTTRQIQRSWYPETVDAQGLTWTADGNWLLLWESPAYGHKLLLYTADGQFFRSIGAPSLVGGDGADLEPGIKLCSLSPDSTFCAVGDHSRGVRIVGTRTWGNKLTFVHPATVVPKDTLQVWQEQLSPPAEGRTTHTFLRATQMVSPPSRLGEGKPGCSLAAFDASSTLIATRLDDSPSTIWIWDVNAGELRAVLMFHSTVNIDWHPTIRELLLVTCQDENHRGVSFVWDPLSNGPRSISMEALVPDGKILGKTQSAWINDDTESPVLLVSDAQRYLMMLCADADQCPTPWHDSAESERGFGSARDVSYEQGMGDAGDVSALVDDTSTLDDTFSFKHP